MRGLNYGTMNLDDSSDLTLRQLLTLRRMLTLDKSRVKNANTVKSDLTLQFQSDDQEGDNLCEVHLVFSQDLSSKNEMKDELRESQAEKYLSNILSKSKLESTTGETVATLQEVSFVAPRGRYTVNFYAKYLGLHGKTFSHRIQYKQIKKGFILPLNNESQVAIVLYLSRPITLGQTHHSYLVLEISKEAWEEKVPINKKPLQDLSNLQELMDSYSGKQFQIIVDLLHFIAGISLIQPSHSYKSVTGHPAVSANYKAQAGWLYMLKNSLIFIPRPVCYVKVAEIGSVRFERAGASNKLFDMKFFMKGMEKAVEIKSVDKVEMDGLDGYFRERGIAVERERPVRVIQGPEDSEEEDEDFNAEDVKESSYSSSQEQEIGSEQSSQITGQRSKPKPPKKKNRAEGDNPPRKKK